MPDEHTQALAFNMETTNPFDWEGVGGELDFYELMEAIETGPCHRDYRTKMVRPLYERVVYVFACDCYGQRVYNLNVFSRMEGEERGTRTGPPGPFPHITALAMSLGFSGVTFANRWRFVPLPDDIKPVVQ